MVRVFVERNQLFFNELIYIWEVYCRDQNIDFVFVNEISAADISVGPSAKYTIVIDPLFYENLLSGRIDNDAFVSNKAMLFNKEGQRDHLSTSFFILSCAQELGKGERDEFNRFKFSSSFQYKLKIEREDLVSNHFDELTAANEILKNASKKKFTKSTVFLSHDIDMLFGSLFQDAYACLKSVDPTGVLKVLFKNIFGTPLWMNMRRIIDIEKKYGYTSTYFWLAQRGKSHLGVSNADYSITDQRVQQLLDLVEKSGSLNAIHKSISLNEFADEIKRIGRTVVANRYHYLAMDPHKDLIKMEKAGIKFDSSFSFAEKTSFRNGYSKPYLPYLFMERRPARLVECPMHIMDTTYYNYLKLKAEDAYTDITSFVESHGKNAVISILWHNNFVSDYKYKSYCLLYEKILLYLSDRGIKSVSPLDMIRDYKL